MIKVEKKDLKKQFSFIKFHTKTSKEGIELGVKLQIDS